MQDSGITFDKLVRSSYLNVQYKQTNVNTATFQPEMGPICFIQNFSHFRPIATNRCQIALNVDM
jgi:hypothetical protein